MDLDPYEGLFICGPRTEQKGEMWQMRLPRQLDDSLGLDILDADGGQIRNIGLGRLIAESGYSYDDQDLLDISVTVDLTLSSALVQVSGWESATESSLDF